MSIPVPRPGLVIRYSFLWRSEAGRGATEGAKDRPCAIVVAVPTLANGAIRTIVAPITHTPPRDPESSLELPPEVSRMLKLDGERHWIRLDELNRFTWPGYDLRPTAPAGDYVYGLLPKAFYEQLRSRIAEFASKHRLQALDRD